MLAAAVSVFTAVHAGWNAILRMFKIARQTSNESTELSCESSPNAEKNSVVEKVEEVSLSPPKTSSTTVSCEAYKEASSALEKHTVLTVSQVDIIPVTPVQYTSAIDSNGVDKSYSKITENAMAASSISIKADEPTPSNPDSTPTFFSNGVNKHCYTSGYIRAFSASQNKMGDLIPAQPKPVATNILSGSDKGTYCSGDTKVIEDKKCPKGTTRHRHNVAECPQIVPSLQVNHSITPAHWSPHYIVELDRVIFQSFERERISPMRRLDLNMALSRVNMAIKQHLINKGHPKAHYFRLEVFGSTENGFGSIRSDLDVCFHYGEILNAVGYQRSMMQQNAIHDFASALHNSNGFTEVTSIPAAKVPIVKFKTAVISGEIDGDISYYNQLAIHNTRLLKRYCSWTKDDQLSMLGMFVKRWAKQCDIAFACKGSLSSYAYNILVIHFLQRLEHPLLPMLQLMGDKKAIFVDGFDVYFCDDEPKPDWSQCRLSVGELFLQFLDFYAKFNWDTEIVQIRQTKVLIKRDIGWTKKICIQDPFELNHNLGHGVGDQMFDFIKKSFASSREIFFSLRERDTFYRKLGGKKEEFDLPIADTFISGYGNALLAKCRIGNAPQYNRPNRRYSSY